jgi:hypothetical protein
MSVTVPAASSEIPGHSYRGHGDQALWSAVVQQALNDLDFEPYGSQLYVAATAFLLRCEGEWAASRAAIADQLNLHADDLRHAGQRHLAERLAREPLPTPCPRPVAPTALPPVTRPHPLASLFQFNPYARLPSTTAPGAQRDGFLLGARRSL